MTERLNQYRQQLIEIGGLPGRSKDNKIRKSSTYGDNASQFIIII